MPVPRRFSRAATTATPSPGLSTTTDGDSKRGGSTSRATDGSMLSPTPWVIAASTPQPLRRAVRAAAHSSPTATTTSAWPMSTATAATRCCGDRRLSTTTGACSTPPASATAMPSTSPSSTRNGPALRSLMSTRSAAPMPGMSTMLPPARFSSKGVPRASTTDAVWPPKSTAVSTPTPSGVPATRRCAVPPTAASRTTRRCLSTSVSTGTAMRRTNFSTE